MLYFSKPLMYFLGKKTTLCILTSVSSWFDPRLDLAVLLLVTGCDDAADSDPVWRVFLLLSTFLYFFAKASFH